MRQISLTVLGLYLSLISAFSQNSDSSNYKSRKLQLEEVNFVSSYYNQDGNHSAVTGGIGTEKLSNYGGAIELKLFKYDKKSLRHSFGIEAGYEHYSSASSDKIDPATISSASMDDNRIYQSVSYGIKNEKKRTSFGLTGSHSKESDYLSRGLALNFSKTSKDKNSEYGIKMQGFWDEWWVILPIELRPPSAPNGKTYSPRNSYSAALSFARIINRHLQVSVVAEPTYQEGLLATRYQRVYFKDGSLQAENLPGKRLKLPVGVRANYFMGDKTILRSYYRFYTDDWGLKAHTLELETPVKLTPFASLSPFYRFHIQNSTEYFAPFGQHLTSAKYFTSDYDLSSINSHFTGIGFRLAPPRGILGIQAFNSMEVRYGHYFRSDGLQSNIVTMLLKAK